MRLVPTLAATALLLGGTASLLAAPCPSEDGPAATLLFPYVEVDLDGGRTTLIAIANTDTDGDRQPAPTLARVTLWTDWAIPTVSFDLFLPPGAVQTLNLRDLFTSGDAPVTRPPLFSYPLCGATVGGHVATPATLQAQHTGRPANGSCYASPRSDTSLATGYVTVDVVRRCSQPAVNPSTPGYLTGIASTRNRLWGDFILVDPDQNQAVGFDAVAVVADAAAFAPGDATFYGRYVGWNAADERRPLSPFPEARFALGGAFDGTDLLVWRDHGRTSVAPRPCGSNPTWYPLIAGVEAFDEDGRLQTLDRRTAFPLATQRVSVGSALDPPYDFGWLALYLHTDLSGRFSTVNAWAGVVMSAQGRFSVGMPAATTTWCRRLQ